MNTKLRIEARNGLEKDFFNLMNYVVLEKTKENVKKHRDIKLMTINQRRSYLVSQPNYHTTKWFQKNQLKIKKKKKKIVVKINKPVHLGL